MQLVLTQKHFDLVGDSYKTSVTDTSGARIFHGLVVRRISIQSPSYEGPSFSPTALEYLRVIADAGVVVQGLGVIHKTVMNNRVQLMRLLWELLAVGASDADVCRRYVQHAHITPEYSAAMSTALLSAFSASGSLSAVTVESLFRIRGAAEDRPQAWKWIAYALFCGTPSHRRPIHSVSLNVGNFSGNDLQQIREVVSAEDPMSVLLGRPSSVAMKSVSAARFHLSDPTKKKKPKKKKASEDATSVTSGNLLHDLPVLQQSKVWTTVLLPGWGEAWVHRDDVIATTRGELGPFAVQAIPQVTLIGLSDDTKDAVMDLLRLICSGVRQLSIRGIPVNFNEAGGLVVDDWCDTIFDVCPHLECLELEYVGIRSLAFLLDAYESGKCKLAVLKVFQRTTSTIDDSVCRLFAALSDKHHAASRCLRELAFYPVRVPENTANIMQLAAMSMLEQNKTLDAFDVRVYVNGANQNQLSRWMRPLKAHDGELVFRACAPLNVRQRLAFLSVVHPRNGSQTKRSRRRGRAIELLDAHVLSLIFTMAAPCIRRYVYLGEQDVVQGVQEELEQDVDAEEE